jgi:hypothetical protein
MKRRTLLKAGAGTMLLASEVTPGKTREPAAPDRREQLYALMGKLPPRDRKVSAQLVSTEEREHYILEKLILDLNGQEPAPAYFARPRFKDNRKSGRLPTVLFNHSHGGGYQIGKAEFIDGRDYL